MYNVIYILLLFFLIFYNLKCCCCKNCYNIKKEERTLSELELLNIYKAGLDETIKKNPLEKNLILNKLNITDDLIDEIQRLPDTKSKLKKIIENCDDIFDLSIYDYMPRCMILHNNNNNNCALESHFNSLLSNPWFIKFFYLINQCCKEYLNKKFHITSKICNLVNYAVNNPNIYDTINAQICCDISIEFFKNKKLKAEYCDFNGENYKFGNFQDENYNNFILKSAIVELDIGKSFLKNLFSDISVFSDKIYIPLNNISTVINKMFYHYNEDINDENYTFYFPCRSIKYYECNFHFSTYRYILGKWYSYDSYREKYPKKITYQNYFNDLIKNHAGNMFIAMWQTNIFTDNYTRMFTFLKNINKPTDLDEQDIKKLVIDKKIKSCYYNWKVMKGKIE